METFTVLVALIIIVSLLLILVVMVQNPKGGGLSSTFGSSTQQLGGVKKTTDFLDKSTWVLAGFLAVLILASNIVILPNKAGVGGASDSILIEQNEQQEAIPEELPELPLDEVDEVIENEAPESPSR